MTNLAVLNNYNLAKTEKLSLSEINFMTYNLQHL